MHNEEDDIIALGPLELTEPPWKGKLPAVPAFMNSDLQIMAYQEALEAVWIHTGGFPDREVAGILLGDIYQDEQHGIFFVEIQQAFPINSAESGFTFVRFDQVVWCEVDDICRNKYPNLKKVGWYHSHPGLGLFFSRDDVSVHLANFPLPWHIALVVDSVTSGYAFFRWKPDLSGMAWSPRCCIIQDGSGVKLDAWF